MKRFLLFISGAVINYLGLKDRFQLITKRRYLNDEIKQKSKELDQERINTFNASKLAGLGDMAGGIAYEMNNPLAIIQGFARKLKRSISDNKEASNTDESVRALEKIIETTNLAALAIKILSILQLKTQELKFLKRLKQKYSSHFLQPSKRQLKQLLRLPQIMGSSLD